MGLIEDVKECMRLVKGFDKRLSALETLIGADTRPPTQPAPLRELPKPKRRKYPKRQSTTTVNESRAIVSKQIEAAGPKGVPAKSLQEITGMSKTTLWHMLTDAKKQGHVYNKDGRWFLVPKSMREAHDTVSAS